jgi:hypothetical protein
MQALVHHGPGSPSWEGVPGPTVDEDGDAVAVVMARRVKRPVCGREPPR